MRDGHIFFIMWVSWAGKWTLIENLKKQTEINLDFVRSYVTRPIREWEIEWNIYYFISLDDFKKWVKNNEFLEYEINHKMHYYWTKYNDVVINGIEKWKIIIKEIEVKWLNNIFINNPQLRKYITSIFLDISEEELENRIKKRWAYMSDEELKNRKNSVKMEKRESKKICDFIINTTNYTKQDTLNETMKIIKKIMNI